MAFQLNSQETHTHTQADDKNTHKAYNKQDLHVLYK